ncbi:hypothetical protein DS6A_3 [Mycobacterium phage DS6A]|uniref:Uncharacterized protein n=1 Tax=Mycobacterium phage DS6A TaxID=45764 RepID=G8I4B3_9CAUD|nr:hypothetical protein DS6A_3 [Mycobacterium phage DS6A]AER47557.1 hypothetical protein DS6A_3 [Mycobacterium phage DS6A]
MNWDAYNRQRAARIAAEAAKAPELAYCPECGTDRRVSGLMGADRRTLSTCGHVVSTAWLI